MAGSPLPVSIQLPQSNNPLDIRKALLDIFAKITAAFQSAIPPGVVWEYAGPTAPSGFLMCDGTSYASASYPALFSAIGTTFGAVDSSHFNVPDHREAAGVGIGTRAAGVTDHDIFTLGQFKDDEGQGHAHQLKKSSGTGSYAVSGYGTGPSINADVLSFAPAQTQNELLAIDPITDGNNGTPRMGRVTRGKRIGMNYIIKT